MSEQRRKRRSEVEIHGDILKFLEKTGEEDPGTGIQNKKLEFTPPSTIMSKKAPSIYPFTADITVQDFFELYFIDRYIWESQRGLKSLAKRKESNLGHGQNQYDKEGKNPRLPSLVI